MERFNINFLNESVNFGTHKRGDDSDVATWKLWNCKHGNAHATLPFQSSKGYTRLDPPNRMQNTHHQLQAVPPQVHHLIGAPQGPLD